MDVGALFWRASNGWLRRAGAGLRPTGLSYVQAALLDGLASGGSPTQIALARRVGCDPMTASQALRALERRRLIVRRRDRGDPRALVLALTPMGEATLARARPALAAAAGEFFASLGPDAPAFAAALGQLIGVRARVRVLASSPSTGHGEGD